MVVAEAELARRAQHPLGVDAEDAALGDRAAVGHLGAEDGERHDVAGREVERAAPDVALAAVAGVDPHPLRPCAASGGCSVRRTRAVTTPGTPPVRIDVLDREAELASVSASASRSTSSGRATYSRSQERSSFMRTAPRSGCRR